MHEHQHHAIFLVLSLVVAVLGSWTALDLFRRVRSHIGQARGMWLGTAAVAMGLSIWSMHFVAMLGFDPGSPVRYDPWLTLTSLLIAIGATWGAFLAASKPGAATARLLAAGGAMGAGICLMHYVGMAALRTGVSLGHSPVFVAASFLIAVAASTAALFAARHERTLAWRAGAAAVLGFAIAGMHYTAMAGLRLTPAAGAAGPVPGLPPITLGVAVAAGAVVILLLALLASIYDQRLNVLTALDAGRVGYWELILPQMDFHISSRGKEVFGRDPDAPFTHAEVLAALGPEDRAARDTIFRSALEGEGDYNAEYCFLGADGARRWINIRGRVVARRHGRPARMAGVVVDVSDRRAAFAALSESQGRQRLLIDELNHRVKNTLATVQSIARQSAKGTDTVAAFCDAFEARLVALSQTHDTLTRGGWSGASLRDLLEQEFAPYAGGQVRLRGEDVDLEPRQTLSLGMIFHELSTNAAKYGALATPDGCVTVEWRREDRHIELLWVERGGPLVQPPTRRGFGSKLIQGSVARELDGSAELFYERDGFRARLCFPYDADVGLEGAALLEA